MLRPFFDVFLFEDLPASGRRADQVYLDEVDRCDVYVGLFGNDYGYEDAAGVSPTEREFDRATAAGKERLIFIKGDSDSARHPKMQALVRRAAAQVIRRRFAETADLTDAVYASLVGYLGSVGVIQNRPFDERACPDATLDDIDGQALADFVRRARAVRQFPLAVRTPMAHGLAHLHMLVDGRPTNAAVLLFGRDPQRFVPSAEVRCMHFHGTEIQRPAPYYQIFKGRLFEQVDHATNFVLSVINCRVGTRAQSTRAPVAYEIPPDVVREAIVNAVAHRDYALAGAVQVSVFADRVEVWNPGVLPPPLTLERLRQGERLRGFDINTLTVIATESYEQFAENLQKEIEADTGIRFGIVEKYQFAAIPVTDEAGRTTALGVAQSEAIWTHLKESGYVDAKGRVQDELRKALVQETLQLPEPFRPHLPQVRDILRKLAGKLDVKDANQRVQIRTRQAVLHSPEFQALWDRIKHKTTYRVKFDNERLVGDCVRAIQDCPPITKTRVHIRKADLAIGRGGVDAAETAAAAPVTLDETDIELPDVLTDLQDKTQLTRRSLVRILSDSGRLDDFARNPQQFIELATESINRTKRMALVDGIKYQRLGDEYYYAQELFEQEELTGYLKNTLAVTKSVHEHVVYDLGGERSFAEKLEQNEAVKVYAKLPGWFKVPTPLGTYNPDWAVLVEQNGAERLFFVVETKPSLFAEDLRGKEDAKIECGKAHFKELSAGDKPVEYVVARNFDDFTTHW